MSRGRPHLRLKLAASLDGRTALASGESRWITGAEARRDVQKLRARSSAVLTGIGTVLADDPRLDVRENFSPAAGSGRADIRQPLRVIADSRLRTPPGARMLLPPGRAIIASVNDAVPAAAALRKAGAEVTVLPAAGEHVDLAALLAHLGHLGVNELHVECGATLAGALLDSGLVDELVIYLAPVLLGSEARPLAALKEITGMAERLELRLEDLRAVGNDLRLTAAPISKE